MKYNKPEVVKVANAVYAIQGQEKFNQVMDQDGSGDLNTINAYEADE